ncbi:MAG: hypothetical protein A2284_02675 [Deltaproteobacteria bacterium RIFOXYA12_FULL_61_11]|nr:MAG: hypothetical protein A2284_02675 [Deltaproteobacteria bacterium RIFOXYA12_FULL_61_11]
MDTPSGTSWLKAMGPGILFAGAAIGGSHLVQSTRAGAEYGFSLLGIILLINLAKYPFFEAAHRYTAATGESLLQGYRRLGGWALYGFTFIASISAVTNLAAVTMVNAGLLGNLLHWEVAPLLLSGVLLSLVAVILVLGRYPLLDGSIKVMVGALSVLTVTAVLLAVGEPRPASFEPSASAFSTLAGFTFVIALMGWMPAPIDISAWSSLWALARQEQTRHRPTLRETLLDFHFGYCTTAVLACFFLALGALVMYGRDEHFAASGVAFSAQLVDLYARTLGAWSTVLISLVAFLTMFSTTLTAFDGYSRTLEACTGLLRGRQDRSTGTLLYFAYLALLAAFSLAVIGWFDRRMVTLVDTATVLAFLSAPFCAWLNHRVVRLGHVPDDYRPRTWLTILSWAGLGFLLLFGLIYLLWSLGWFSLFVSLFGFRTVLGIS